MIDKDHPKKGNTVPVHVQNIVTPTLILFRLGGLYSKKRNRSRQIILALLFHVMYLWIVAFKIFCLSLKLNWGSVSATVVKVIPLSLWWLVRLRMKKILSLVKKLELFGEEIPDRDCKKVSKLTKTVIIVATSVIFLHPIFRTLSTLIISEEVAVCLYHELYSIGKRNRAIIFLLHELFNNCPDAVITVSIVLFFSFYCYALSLALQNKRISKNQTYLVYERTLRIFKELENAFSPLIFLVFSHIVFEFLRIMFLIAFMLNYDNTTIIYTEFLSFFTQVTLIFLTVLAADKAQVKANDLRVSLLAFYKTRDAVNSSGEVATLIEDRKLLRFTAWGIFTIRKPLFLSLSAWLFAYGVILLQFMKPSS
ncbi:uncharacterized protein NPIL_421281 [Nephila pilipes]|uniref:Uncharacterized protein n=1 Tax=Nephila pilipes TaxID=299642 RepID=A0A8X6SZB1_NEPPI|nr:uncharacterized protein NPIL_421281 [Nephila pilipes]